MQKMKKKLTRILSLVLMISMLMSNGTMAFATEITDSTVNGTVSVESSSESMDIGETTNRTSETEDAAGSEEEGSQKQENPVGSEKSEALEDGKSIEQIENTEEVNTDETVSEDAEEQLGTSIEENQQERAEDEFFYRVLDAEEVEEKEQLSVDTTVVADAKEGEDFVKNEVIYLCDTKEDAEKAAKAYADATGYTVKIKSFSYGVAVFSISGSPKKNDGYHSTNSVQRVMEYAADMTNNLPAVYPNYIRQAHTVNTSNESFNDPFLKMESGMYQWYHEMINDKPIWESIDNGSLQINLSTATVAVFDTGINAFHVELGSKVVGQHTILQQFDSEGNRDGLLDIDEANDDNSHGTNCAGIIGAVANNSIGGRGVASGVNLFAMKVANQYGSFFDSDIIQGFVYILNFLEPQYRPQVINMSFGSRMFNGAYVSKLNELHDAGITLVASAGNENLAVPSYPAAYEHVISVAALNDNYEKAQFSNYGNTVDIAAPGGEHRYNAKIAGNVERQLLWSTGIAGQETDVYGYNYVGMEGTSQAAPIVAAAAALLYAQNPDITPDEVERILRDTAKPLSSKYKIGAGCVDVAAALQYDTTVSKPRIVDDSQQEIVSGVVPAGIKLQFEDLPNTQIYYTLNGKNPEISKAIQGPPDPLRLTAGGTYLYNPLADNPIILGNSGTTTVKAIALKFGKVSEVVSYSYSFQYAGASITEIKINPAGDLPFINSVYGDTYKLAVGKKQSFKTEVLPSYVKNKKVTWESGDPSIASVDTNGNVTAMAVGETFICAKAVDGSDVSATIGIMVVPATKILTVHTSKEEILLYGKASLNETSPYYSADTYTIGNGFDSGRNECQSDIVVYPNYEQEYLFTSSNPSVAAVDKFTGTITAGIAGTAKITVMATDGTGVKDTVSVKVVIPISCMEVIKSEPENAEYQDKIAVGQTIAPKIIYNEGYNIPTEKGIIWEVVQGSDYASLNYQTGAITARKEGKIVVKASSIADPSISDLWAVQICPKTYGLYCGGSFGGKIGARGSLWDVTNNQGLKMLTVYPSNTIEKYLYKSSNPKIVTVDENGVYECLNVGNAKITITANDGSGKNVIVPISVWGDVGLESPMEHSVLYPGKSITFKLSGTQVTKLNKKYGAIQALINDNDPFLDNYASWITTNGMKLQAKSGNYYMYGKNSQIIEVDLGEWYFNGWSRHYEFYSWNYSRIEVEFYADGTNQIVVDESLFLQPGERTVLAPVSLPSTACQKYYSFTSSNPKIVAVDKNTGSVRALANGTAKITVTAGDGSGKKAICNVVVSKEAESVEIVSKTGSFEVAVGKSLQLSAKVDPKAGKKTVQWISTNPSITIDKNGKVSVPSNVTPGTTATIYAKPDAGGEHGEVVVTAKAATTSVYTTEAYTGNQVTMMTLYTNSGRFGNLSTSNILNYNVNMDASTEYSIVSSNTKIATVEKNGTQFTVNAVAKGNANIKLSALDGTGKNTTIKVNVIEPVTDLSIETKTAVKDLLPGKSIQLTAITNVNASNKKVIWTIDSQPYEVSASIDQNGKLSISKGTISYDQPVGISATTTDGSNIRSETYWFYIRPRAAAKLESDKKSVSMLTGGTDYLYISVLDKDGSPLNSEITAKSSNTDVVSVMSSTNNVTLQAGNKPGKATITIMAVDGSNKKISIPITVSKPVTNLQIKSSNNEYNLATGKSLQLQAITNKDATNKQVEWILSGVDERYVSISNKGVLTVSKDMPYPVSATVYATAKDGAGAYAQQTINLYQAAQRIDFLKNGYENCGSKIIVPKSEGSFTLVIKSENSNAYNDYYVTYTGTAGKVRYTTNTSASQTEVIFTPTKVGTTTVTVNAQDGTSLKGVLQIEVK